MKHTFLEHVRFNPIIDTRISHPINRAYNFYIWFGPLKPLSSIKYSGHYGYIWYIEYIVFW